MSSADLAQALRSISQVTGIRDFFHLSLILVKSLHSSVECYLSTRAVSSAASQETEAFTNWPGTRGDRMKAVLSRILSEGFRVFFLAAGLYGMFTGIVWVIWLGVHAAGGMVELPSHAVPPHQWHAHEMIFGYATAAIGGFFLTAVPNWTNTPAARAVYISSVAGLWLAGRIAIWYTGQLPHGLVAVIDLAFIPVLAIKIVGQLAKRPKPQNLVFLLFLLAIWSGNLSVHLDWLGHWDGGADVGTRVGVLAIAGMIAVLGGRVTPAFTRNAMKRAGLPIARWPLSTVPLDRVSLGLAVVLPWVALVTEAGGVTAGALAIILGLVQVMRLSRWRGRWTWNQPILWSLHLGVCLLGIGLILWGLAQFDHGSEVAALHVIGMGCVGTMTLAVMSRAALGHTGRALIAPGPVALAYGLIPLAALLRWIGSNASGNFYYPTVIGSGLLWTLAFALFLMSIWPVLSGPRIGHDD